MLLARVSIFLYHVNIIFIFPGAVSNLLEVGNVFCKVDLPHFHEQIFYIEEATALTLYTLYPCICRFNPTGVNLVADAGCGWAF